MFEAVACHDLVRIKYDQEIKLLKLSDSLQRVRTASSRGSSGSDGLSQLGDSIANLGRTMRVNEIRDQITAMWVEIAAIDYNLSNRCRYESTESLPREPPADAPHDPDSPQAQ